MSLNTNFLNQVFQLPAHERADLARRIILSLEEQPFDADADVAWDAAIDARALEIDESKVQLIDYRKSIADARASLRRHDQP